MDLAQIAILIAAVIGSGGIIGLLYLRLTRNQLKADTHKTDAETKKTDAETEALKAETEDLGAGTLIGIIGVLRGELTRLGERLADLEIRVTALEQENRGLKQMVATFRDLVGRLWAIVKDNDLEADGDLAEAVYEALEDSSA